MKTALVIMAAGIGSRFGGGIKQLAAVGPNGEIIMDYSIHDAIEAGFDKIVFIIRHGYGAYSAKHGQRDLYHRWPHAPARNRGRVCDGAGGRGVSPDTGGYRPFEPR